MRRLTTSSVLIFALISAACGPRPVDRGTTAGSVDVPRRIDDDSYAEMSRLLVGLSLDDPSYGRLRHRLVSYLARQTPEVIEDGDYSEVAEHFARISDLYSPEDYGEGRVPRALRPLAAYLVEHGSPQGDEGRVLSALLVLSVLQDEAAHREEYRELSEWGREARQTLPSRIDRYSRLIEVWAEHARLTPTPDVLSYLARLHLERRDAVVQLIPRDGARPPVGSGFSMQDMRMAPILLRRAPLEVAAVFLMHGDTAKALSHVEAMGDASGIEMHLVRLLRDAHDGDDDAMLELARAYTDQWPEVARGMCGVGHRHNRDEPRYPLCLARVEAQDEDYANATGWYAEAIRLNPSDRSLYEEALTGLARFITRGLFDSDPSSSRAMAEAAESILRQHSRRFPQDDPPVPPWQLHYVIGLLEMNAGNAQEAIRRLEASVEANETPEALLELGRLAERTGNHEGAVRHYRRALDLTPSEDQPGIRSRAVILEHMGDAYRGGDDEQQSQRMYRQALAMWEQAEPLTRGLERAEVQLRMGVLLDRTNHRDRAVEAFQRAMQLAPARREVYARILSHLVVSEPDVALARTVFDRALRQLSLEPEWRVYFALWIETIAAIAGEEAGDNVTSVLRSHSAGQAWWGRLARFGRGELPFEELLGEASSVGERTEAHFYQGTRLLAGGDRDAALDHFDRVIETHMINFYEHTMALELKENIGAR